MKKYLKKYMFVCIGILLMVLIGYVVLDNQMNETISISYDSKTLDLKPLYYRNEPFKVFFESYGDIPEMTTDINLLIDFHDVVVDEIEILEYILDEQGHMRFTEKEIRTLPMQVLNNGYFLTLDEHPAMYLSSSIDDFVYHGIEMVITGNQQTKSYLFVFKSVGSNLEVNKETPTIDNGDPSIYGLVLQGLIDADVSLNDDMSYIAIDCTEVDELGKIDLMAIKSDLSSYQIPILEETFESLKEQNLLIDDDYLEGILLKLNRIDYTSDNEVLVEASIYKSTLKASDYQFLLKKVDGVWEIISSLLI